MTDDIDVKTTVLIGRLKKEVDDKKYVDVGKGAAEVFNVKRTKLQAALNILKDAGYSVLVVQVEQKDTDVKRSVKVLAPPGTTYMEVFRNKDRIQQVGPRVAQSIREKNSAFNETNPSTQGETMSEEPTTETPEQPVVTVDTDAAASRTRAFFRRHKGKFVAAGLFGLSGVSFLAGRKSSEVVEDVEVVVETPDSDSQTQD